VLRPPKDVLEYELAAEGVSSLGRVGVQLERALAVLAAFDAAVAAARASAPDARAELVADAADRLWVYVVQREAMGLVHHERELELLGVPRDVRARMGPRRKRREAG
jgi:hypothetical protein